MASKMRTVLVAGRNAAATAVVDALATLPGVGCVRQLGELDVNQAARQLAGADALVDMVGGVAPAFTTAMAAMGQGLSVITANPLLMASHGRVLQNAALGQHVFFGFQAAGFGMPVQDVMTALRPSKVTASFTTAASMALARMAFRNETAGTISAYLKFQQVDLSDWGGKVTQARALALRSLWHDEELRGQQLARVGVEAVEPADMRRLREFGLQPVFGAEITENGIYSGPMAVAPDSPLLGAVARDVLVAETAQGEMVLTHSGDEMQRAIGGILADVRQFLRAPKPAMDKGVRDYGLRVRGPEAVRAYVRVPYAARELVLAAKPEIMLEKVDGDGLWQAVIGIESLSQLKIGAVGGMVYPLSGSWVAPAAGSGGLRLVG